MTIVKSFSFPKGEIRGDTFYIKHNVGAFTVIDCYLLTNSQFKENNRQKEIIDEIVLESKGCIRRFISTHPDKDHIAGLEELFRRWPTNNFYAVANNIPSNNDNASLSKYIEMKDKHNYSIKRGISRCWLNDSDNKHKSCGINFQWPVLSNVKFKEALKKVSKGEDVNNICPVFTYSLKNGPTYMWMGDLGIKMQEEFYKECKDTIPQADILFHPHHGRDTGKVPEDLLNLINPQLIIIGNAPSDTINYGDSRMTITQNSSGDLTFINDGGYVHIYSENKVDNLPTCLEKQHERSIQNAFQKDYYCGSLKVK